MDDGREPLSGFLVRQSPRLSNQNITKLVENFPNLTELRLSQIQKLDNSSLDLLHSLKSLTLLDISSAGLTGENLTDEGVIPLIKAVGGKLETLNLSSNQNLTDGCLTQGIKSACPNLRVLGLSELDLTPTGVKDLFSSWFENTGLEKLDLKGCLDLDDEAIQAVVAHSGRELRDLDLHSVDAKLTEVGLKAVASGCPELRKLDLGFVRALDDFILVSESSVVPVSLLIAFSSAERDPGQLPHAGQAEHFCECRSRSAPAGLIRTTGLLSSHRLCTSSQWCHWDSYEGGVIVCSAVSSQCILVTNYWTVA